LGILLIFIIYFRAKNVLPPKLTELLYAYGGARGRGRFVSNFAEDILKVYYFTWKNFGGFDLEL